MLADLCVCIRKKAETDDVTGKNMRDTTRNVTNAYLIIVETVVLLRDIG